MPNPIAIAGELYTTYCQAVGGKAFNGDPLPTWEAFLADQSKQQQSGAWIRVAEKAITMLSHPEALSQ